MKDFTKSVNVTKDDNTVTVLNDGDEDLLLYVGMIVSRSSLVEKRIVKYAVSFAVRTCIRWLIYKNKWIPYCNVNFIDSDFMSRLYTTKVVVGTRINEHNHPL